MCCIAQSGPKNLIGEPLQVVSPTGISLQTPAKNHRAKFQAHNRLKRKLILDSRRQSPTGHSPICTTPLTRSPLSNITTVSTTPGMSRRSVNQRLPLLHSFLNNGNLPTTNTSSSRCHKTPANITPHCTPVPLSTVFNASPKLTASIPSSAKGKEKIGSSNTSVPVNNGKQKAKRFNLTEVPRIDLDISDDLLEDSYGRWHGISKDKISYFEEDELPAILIHGIEFEPVEMREEIKGLEDVSISDEDGNWKKCIASDYQEKIQRADKHLEYTTQKDICFCLCAGLLIEDGNWKKCIASDYQEKIQRADKHLEYTTQKDLCFCLFDYL